MLTLKEYLHLVEDKKLLKIFDETNTGVVPKDGHAHSFCRDINTMIDSGVLQANPTSYRRVYLPTLTRYVEGELALRYAQNKNNGRL